MERKNETVYHATIGTQQVREAANILNSYKRAKTNLEKRIIENDKWWKMRHWDLIRKASVQDPEPASAWLFNSLANKHADVMDNYPEPCVLPREKGDTDAAKSLRRRIGRDQLKRIFRVV